jgi:hypothetical protein
VFARTLCTTETEFIDGVRQRIKLPDAAKFPVRFLKDQFGHLSVAFVVPVEKKPLRMGSRTSALDPGGRNFHTRFHADTGSFVSCGLSVDGNRLMKQMHAIDKKQVRGYF